MENQTPLQEKNITISSVEMNEYGWKVKDQNNMVFNISRNKSDGTPSKAGTIFEMIQNPMGASKCFKYAEVDNKQGGKSRYVRIIAEPTQAPQGNQDGQAVFIPTNSQNNTSGANTASDEDSKWEKINFGKCKHQFLLEAYKAGLTRPNETKNIDTIEKEAEEMATRSMRILKPVKDMDEETKKIHGETGVSGQYPIRDENDDEIKTEDIPF